MQIDKRTLGVSLISGLLTALMYLQQAIIDGKLDSTRAVVAALLAAVVWGAVAGTKELLQHIEGDDTPDPTAPKV